MMPKILKLRHRPFLNQGTTLVDKEYKECSQFAVSMDLPSGDRSKTAMKKKMDEVKTILHE